MAKARTAMAGALYLMLLGAVAIAIMRFARKGLWDLVAERFG